MGNCFIAQIGKHDLIQFCRDLDICAGNRIFKIAKLDFLAGRIKSTKKGQCSQVKATAEKKPIVMLVLFGKAFKAVHRRRNGLIGSIVPLLHAMKFLISE